MKTIEIDIDENCPECCKALEYMKELTDHHENHYGNMDMATGEYIKGITIVPNYNSHGHHTHWHIKKED